MGFLQGPVTNIHRLNSEAAPEPSRSLAVVVPMAARDVNKAVAERVLTAVSRVDPELIVIPARGPQDAIQELTRWVNRASNHAEVIWCNGPEMEDLCSRYELPQAGKGSDMWLALGPAAAAAEVIACIDADVTSTTSQSVRRLVAPLDGSILASKAWYTRVEHDRLYGRLCRLLARPLILAAAEKHPGPFTAYLRAFRYPLSGEVALDASVVSELRLPAGMGLELGTLGELYRVAGSTQVAQVDLGNHRHAHRPVTGEGGLVDIAPEITGALFDILEAHTPEETDFDLSDPYAHWARRLIDQYERDAAINDLDYDAASERAQLEAYREAVEMPSENTWLPPWSSTELSHETVLEAGRPPEAPRTE